MEKSKRRSSNQHQSKVINCNSFNVFSKYYKQIDQSESRRAGSRSLVFIFYLMLLVHKLQSPTMHLHFTDIRLACADHFEKDENFKIKSLKLLSSTEGSITLDLLNIFLIRLEKSIFLLTLHSRIASLLRSFQFAFSKKIIINKNCLNFKNVSYPYCIHLQF